MGPYFFFLSEVFPLHRSLRHSSNQLTMALWDNTEFVIRYPKCNVIIDRIAGRARTFGSTVSTHPFVSLWVAVFVWV